jgi:hypothetical protein
MGFKGGEAVVEMDFISEKTDVSFDASPLARESLAMSGQG